MPNPNSTPAGASAPLGGFLGLIERIGNRLPDQITIFVVLGAVALVASWAASVSGVSVIHPVTGKSVAVYNLLTREGIQWIFLNVVPNFTGFAPLGVVLVAILGIGVADKAGLFTALLKATVAAVPAWAICPTLVFAGVNSNIASDAGYVILPPIAALVYASVGRNPLAGIAAAFAGVAAGFSANLLPSTLDPMLAGLSQEGARLMDARYNVNPLANYYFLFASVFLLTAVGWFVSVRFVEPNLGPWKPAGDAAAPMMETLTPQERRGLASAGVVFALCMAAILALTLPQNGVLRDDKGGYGPLLASSTLSTLIMAAFLASGIAYGVATGVIRSDKDAARMMSQSIGTMSTYIVLAFFASQFIAWFKQSNLGLIIAIQGAALLKSLHFTGIPLMVAFVVFTATFNLLMSSASAKWALLAPVFVPMLMALGKSPEATQAFYRVGDSCTNVVTPLNFYFPLLLAAAHRYVPTAGIGTLIATMVPYSLAFLAAWTLMLIVWVLLGLPLGPDSPLTYVLTPASAPSTGPQ